jgi:hypothetical protein
MTSSNFFDRREAAPNVAEGWDPVVVSGQVTGWKQNIFSYPSIGSPDGGAHCTADGLVKFLRALRRGDLMSAASTELFLTPQVHHDDSAWYGFGLEFTLDGAGTVRDYYKDGGNTGVGTIARHYPGVGLVLSNAEVGSLAMSREIDRLISQP